MRGHAENLLDPLCYRADMTYDGNQSAALGAPLEFAKCFVESIRIQAAEAFVKEECSESPAAARGKFDETKCKGEAGEERLAPGEVLGPRRWPKMRSMIRESSEKAYRSPAIDPRIWEAMPSRARCRRTTTNPMKRPSVRSAGERVSVSISSRSGLSSS